MGYQIVSKLLRMLKKLIEIFGPIHPAHDYRQKYVWSWCT